MNFYLIYLNFGAVKETQLYFAVGSACSLMHYNICPWLHILSQSLFFFPADIRDVKVTCSDWLPGGYEGNSDGQITGGGQREPDKERDKDQYD